MNKCFQCGGNTEVDGWPIVCEDCFVNFVPYSAHHPRRKRWWEFWKMGDDEIGALRS
jgi:hypothetical protein